MRHDKIQILDSKEKGRVIRNKWLLGQVLDFLTYVILIGFFPILSALFLLDQIENGDYIVGAITLFSISLIFSGLILYSILNLDRLKRIHGTHREQNRERIKNLAEELGWTLQIHNQKVSVVSPPWSLLSTNWGRQIVVIYDRQDILINSTSYGLHDFKSPFHWFGNRKLERIITEEFEKRVKNNDTPTIAKSKRAESAIFENTTIKKTP